MCTWARTTFPSPSCGGSAPPGFLIGASVGSPREVDGGRGADYWGVGPWAATATKGDAGQAIGADGFQRVARLAEGKPCIAIGGVQPEDVPAVIGAHGAGVAVVSGILRGDDVEASTRRLRERPLATRDSRSRLGRASSSY